MSLRVAIIGTGWFANMHAKLLAGMDHVEVCAIIGSDVEKAKQFASQFNGAKGYASIENMLGSTTVDAAYICTPPFAHGNYEYELIEHDIPFLVEKPLSVEKDLPHHILQKIEDKGLITSVGYHFRYTDAADQMKLLLQQRTIGMALGYWMGGAPGGTWWRRQEKSGGQFVEQTTHIVDLLRYFAGEVAEVYAAYGHRQLHIEDANANVADVGTVTLKLVNGSIATISNTCMLAAGEHSGLHIYTNEGKLELSHHGLKDIQKHTVTEYLNRSNPYERESNIFLEAIRTKDASHIRSTYADSVRTHQVTMAANESALTGKPIKL